MCVCEKHKEMVVYLSCTTYSLHGHIKCLKSNLKLWFYVAFNSHGITGTFLQYYHTWESIPQRGNCLSIDAKPANN